MLDHQQSRFNVLEHKPQTWNYPCCSPDIHFISVTPNTEMNSGALNRRSKFRQNCRSKREAMLEHQLLARLFWREKRERYLRKAAFFRPETRPESRVNDGFNCARIGCRREFPLATSSCFREVLSKVRFDSCGHGARCLVSWFLDHAEFYPQLTQISQISKRASVSQLTLPKFRLCGSCYFVDRIFAYSGRSTKLHENHEKFRFLNTPTTPVNTPAASVTASNTAVT